MVARVALKGKLFSMGLVGIEEVQLYQEDYQPPLLTPLSGFHVGQGLWQKAVSEEGGTEALNCASDPEKFLPVGALGPLGTPSPSHPCENPSEPGVVRSARTPECSCCKSEESREHSQMGDVPALLKCVPPALGPEVGPAAHCKGE